MLVGGVVVLFCFIVLILGFVVIVYFRPMRYRGDYIIRAHGETNLVSSKGKLRKSLLRYDHKIFDKIPSNLNTKAKLKILLFMEAEAKWRNDKIQAQTRKERERYRKETARVEELEFELQKTRRSMLTESNDNPEEALHLINKRGKEMFGEEWIQSVQGQPSLGEWVIDSKLPFSESEHQTPNFVPKLNFEQMV